MVKSYIRRLVLRYFPEIGQRKHLPQLARIEKIYDLPTNGSKVSTNFRPYKAADIQLLNTVTNEPLEAPIFEQVTLATGQGNESGLYIEPKVGMRCLVQYIDGLDSHPVITAILPWQTLVPENRATDVVMQQSKHSKIKGSNENWHIETPGEIKQTSQTSEVNAQVREENYHEKHCSIDTHATNKIDGNQINEIMGALKTIVGEKALIMALEDLTLGSKKQVNIKAHENMNLESLKKFEAKAAQLAKVQGATVWLGNNSVNVVQVLLDLIAVVKDTNDTLATHTHSGAGTSPQATTFTGYKSAASGLESNLSPITE
ncbi:hypothetical protein Q4489_04455 [Thalassotalea sp. 1_MG-2023]|uniref:hypothetical protein n=1 Tax=Thalassotalea sp. 1_MG-2023 TaxID=3062680 RepID=UPI0026E2AB81|nr:hypothetical protein [Thalassotalea sp. 1_MG-2023]MDO6426249.1 hypothetical protein [Thalassotalea sp. 1_MG-2023]